MLIKFQNLKSLTLGHLQPCSVRLVPTFGQHEHLFTQLRSAFGRHIHIRSTWLITAYWVVTIPSFFCILLCGVGNEEDDKSNGSRLES